MSHISDLVRDSRLPTHFLPNNTIHTFFESSTASDRCARRQRRIEQWVRSRELGRGSFGIVWLEQCTEEDRVRAVKEIAKKEIREKTYHRELEAVVKFSHPRYDGFFVRSFGWYESPESVFIAMEYILHGDLKKHLEQALPEDQAGQVVRQVLEGLECMHENGFAHRDLKPENIFVVSKPPDKWWVKIGDFGISKRVGGGATALRTINGTPGFIAPEVALRQLFEVDVDEYSYDFTVDLWSLGVITFYMLTKKHPFLKIEGLLSYYRGEVTMRDLCSQYKSIHEETCLFMGLLMAPKPQDRGTATEALLHAWLPKDEYSEADPSTEDETETRLVGTALENPSDSEPEVSTFTTMKSANLPTDRRHGSSDSESESSRLSNVSQAAPSISRAEKPGKSGRANPTEPPTMICVSDANTREPIQSETSTLKPAQSQADAAPNKPKNAPASSQPDELEPSRDRPRLDKIKHTTVRVRRSSTRPKESWGQKISRWSTRVPEESAPGTKLPDKLAPVEVIAVDHAGNEQPGLPKPVDPYTGFPIINPYEIYPAQAPQMPVMSNSRPKRPDTPPPGKSTLGAQYPTAMPLQNPQYIWYSPQEPNSSSCFGPIPNLRGVSEERSRFDDLLAWDLASELFMSTSELESPQRPPPVPPRITLEVERPPSRTGPRAGRYSRAPRECKVVRFVEGSSSQRSTSSSYSDPIREIRRRAGYKESGQSDEEMDMPDEETDTPPPVEAYHHSYRSRTLGQTAETHAEQSSSSPRAWATETSVIKDGYTHLSMERYSEKALDELGIHHYPSHTNQFEILAYGTISPGFQTLLQQLTMELRSGGPWIQYDDQNGNIEIRTSSCLLQRPTLRLEYFPTPGTDWKRFEYKLTPWCLPTSRHLKYSLPLYQTCIFTIATSTGSISRWAIRPDEIRPEILVENNIAFNVQDWTLVAGGQFTPREVNSLRHNSITLLQDAKSGRRSLDFDMLSTETNRAWPVFGPRAQIRRYKDRSDRLPLQSQESMLDEVYNEVNEQQTLGNLITEIDYETFDQGSCFSAEHKRYLDPIEGFNPFEGMLFLASKPTDSIDRHFPALGPKYVEVERIYHPNFPHVPLHETSCVEFERHYHRSNLHVYKKVPRRLNPWTPKF
ncbi:unnamed protein product [Penicillium olsonii]|nr:unnamed protein product [Penicillium olsonii]